MKLNACKASCSVMNSSLWYTYIDVLYFFQFYSPYDEDDDGDDSTIVNMSIITQLLDFVLLLIYCFGVYWRNWPKFVALFIIAMIIYCFVWRIVSPKLCGKNACHMTAFLLSVSFNSWVGKLFNLSDAISKLGRFTKDMISPWHQSWRHMLS